MTVPKWDDACRLCGEEKTEQFCIFGEEGTRRKIIKKLRVCLPVMVYQTDPLPKKICQFCAARLDDVFEFREYCLTVYKAMHRKLLSLKESKNVQIYLDAMNNSPDPCQVQLCKEKGRAPPPLMPLPVSKPLARVVEAFKTVSANNDVATLEPLPELPCEVQIKEELTDDSVLRSELDDDDGQCLTPSSHENRINELKNERDDVIILDEDIEKIDKKDEKRTSILEQVLCGNLTINDCKELTPKSKPTSRWWCSPCNTYYRTKSSLMEHMLCPHMHTCLKCRIVFKTVEDLAKHEATNHLKVNRDFDESVKECHQCDRQFVRSEMLRNHKDRNHVVETIELESSTAMWCSVCNRGLPTTESYNNHMQQHEDGTLAADGVATVPYSESLTQQVNDDLASQMKKEHFIESVKSLTCPLCGKVCTQQSALSNHMRTHEPKKHKCEICGRSFGLFIRLAAHRLNEHGQQPIMSPITASVEQEEALNAEREAREAREARTQGIRGIPVISGSLQDDDEVIVDEPGAGGTTHSSANLSTKNVARCGICQQWFNDHTTMLTHLQTHSDNLMAKTFSCGVCKKNFKEKWQMIRHEVSHKRAEERKTLGLLHTCKTCKESFPTKSQLEAHEAIHTVNRTFHCPKCNKIFFKQVSLIVHQCTGGIGTISTAKRNSVVRKNARKISPGTAAGVKKRKTKTDHLGILNEPTSKNSQHNILERNKSCMEVSNGTSKLRSETETSTPIVEPNVAIDETDDGMKTALPVKRTLIRTSGGFRCGVCQSPFVLRDLAVAHLRSAHPTMPYQCPYCKKRFTTQYTFTHHMKTEHPDESDK